ncbi:MAG: glycosyltransferase family 1 protein [Chloroflexi bacterium]|nr:glycosyltransferase family 1 protein [Chloroflexota bacterium]
MRIAIIALGSRGDVQPYIALGRGLKKAGHAVRLIATQDFETLVKSHGLEFWSIRGNSQESIEGREWREVSEKGNLIVIMSQLIKHALRSAIEWLEDALIACQGMDLLITGSVGLSIGIALAEKYHLPLLQAHLIPLTPTKTFPSLGIPQTLPNLGGMFNLISHQLILLMMIRASRPMLNQARQKVLGLPRASLFDSTPASLSKGFPTLYGFSPSVVPAPADWRADNHVTGYWFLDSADDWTPPSALLNFLQAGPPPVYVGFGSMSSRNPQETADLVVNAIKKTNQRALLFSGWGGLHKKNMPDSVLMIDSTPHDWLFPRVAAVVHHGGAGTTAAGLRAGVPSIVIPFLIDQPFWGRRVYDLGVGPAPIPRRKLTADRLAQAIQEAVTNTAMRQRAAELGSKIRAEDGIANAVEVIQRLGR